MARFNSVKVDKKVLAETAKESVNALYDERANLEKKLRGWKNELKTVKSNIKELQEAIKYCDQRVAAALQIETEIHEVANAARNNPT